MKKSSSKPALIFFAISAFISTAKADVNLRCTFTPEGRVTGSSVSSMRLTFDSDRLENLGFAFVKVQTAYYPDKWFVIKKKKDSENAYMVHSFEGTGEHGKMPKLKGAAFSLNFSRSRNLLFGEIKVKNVDENGRVIYGARGIFNLPEGLKFECNN